MRNAKSAWTGDERFRSPSDRSLVKLGVTVTVFCGSTLESVPSFVERMAIVSFVDLPTVNEFRHRSQEMHMRN